MIPNKYHYIHHKIYFHTGVINVDTLTNDKIEVHSSGLRENEMQRI